MEQVPSGKTGEGDDLSHRPSRELGSVQNLSERTRRQATATETIQKKRHLAHIQTFKQMVSKDVLLQQMDFKDEDLQRAATLYDDLNATACFYTTALRILSKANWSEQVNFESHVGHQATVAVAKGWTCAVGLHSDEFNNYRLALAMSTLPADIHKDLKFTYEAIVAIIPPPFHEQASSKVLFTCRQCQQQCEHEVATFIVTSSLPEPSQSFDYFERAFPWTENLLQVTDEAKQTTCQECASDYDWNLLTTAPCRLVWLQHVREQQPLATRCMQFLDKDPFQSGGRIWECIYSSGT